MGLPASLHMRLPYDHLGTVIHSQPVFLDDVGSNPGVGVKQDAMHFTQIHTLCAVGECDPVSQRNLLEAHLAVGHSGLNHGHIMCF